MRRAPVPVTTAMPQGYCGEMPPEHGLSQVTHSAAPGLDN